MDITFEQLLNELEKLENADYIKYLANLKNLGHIENLKKLSGFSGFITRFILNVTLTPKHMDAFIALSECENAADIVAFKQTKHFEKIRNYKTGYSPQMLEYLKELGEHNYV